MANRTAYHTRLKDYMVERCGPSEWSVKQVRSYFGLPDARIARLKCLRCRKWFKSHNVGNAMCDNCVRITD